MAGAISRRVGLQIEMIVILEARQRNLKQPRAVVELAHVRRYHSTRNAGRLSRS
jgi:hypothetical protein